MISTRGAARRILAVLALATSVGSVAAADYPTKPIRIVVPAAAGGSLDLTARLVGQKMGEKLGQQIYVENRAGAATVIGTKAVKDAPADGYTILAQANGFSMLPYITTSPGFDVSKDFIGLGNMISLPFVMVESADKPDRSVKDFVARAKANRLSYASGGAGNPPHLATAMFMKTAGIDPIDHVLYRGNGAAMPDLVAGRVDIMFDGYISSKSYIDAGKMRALAVTSKSRIAPMPNVPTFQELGYDYSYNLWLGLIIRSETSKEVVQKLSDALRFALEDKELKQRFLAEGSDPTFMTPESFTAMVRKETAEMEPLATELKLEKQ